MYQLEHLPHTADICLRIRADNLPDLFLGALRGMGDFLHPSSCQEAGPCPIHTEIATDSIDRTALLVDFLNDALVAIFSLRAVFCEIDFHKLTETEVIAGLRGVPVDTFDDDIKAVTYHEADVHQNEEGLWETLIIFDI